MPIERIPKQPPKPASEDARKVAMKREDEGHKAVPGSAKEAAEGAPKPKVGKRAKDVAVPREAIQPGKAKRAKGS